MSSLVDNCTMIRTLTYLSTKLRVEYISTGWLLVNLAGRPFQAALLIMCHFAIRRGAPSARSQAAETFLSQ